MSMISIIPVFIYHKSKAGRDVFTEINTIGSVEFVNEEGKQEVAVIKYKGVDRPVFGSVELTQALRNYFDNQGSVHAYPNR